jgi:hypothetical protein
MITWPERRGIASNEFQKKWRAFGLIYILESIRLPPKSDELLVMRTGKTNKIRERKRTDLAPLK